jgi:hypothetical protein
VSVPVRSAAGFAAIAIDTVPLPLPDSPAAIVIHGAFELAVHAQPPADVTLTLAVTAADATRTDVEESAKVQVGGVGGVGVGVGVGVGDGVGVGVGVGGSGVGEGVGVGLGTGVGPGVGDGVGGVGVGGTTEPASVTTTVSPPTRTVAVRSVPGFSAARSVIEALADPVDAPAMVSHAASLTAVHAQPFSVSSATAIVPPPAETAAFDGETLNRQGAASCVTVTCELLTSRIARR